MAKADGGEELYVLEEAQQVGDRFPLAVGQHLVVLLVLGAAWKHMLAGEMRCREAELTATARAEDLCAEAGDTHGADVRPSRPPGDAGGGARRSQLGARQDGSGW